MTAYLKSSFVRLILVFAFAVFMTSGIYIHVGYSIGNFVTGLLGKI